MKLEEGMYVRTKYGIFKIRKITKDLAYWKREKRVLELDRNIPEYKYRFSFYKDESIFKGAKFKDNIIDLIEDDDLIEYRKHGELVLDRVYSLHFFDKYKLFVNCNGEVLDLEDLEIVSILTKEQFESMSYKVGE